MCLFGKEAKISSYVHTVVQTTKIEAPNIIILYSSKVKHEDGFMIVVLEIYENCSQVNIARVWQIMRNMKSLNCNIWSIFSNSLFSTKWHYSLLVDTLIQNQQMAFHSSKSRHVFPYTLIICCIARAGIQCS